MTSRPNIVVGIDGSSRGDDALELGSVLAEATRTGLLLVHAYGPGEDHRGARELLESRRTAVGAVSVEVVAHADPSPARALARVAAARGAAVIVVGPSHRARLGLILPGSTGRQLVEITRRTVAVVPRGWRRSTEGLSRIGCGYDASAESEAALETAAELSRMAGGELEVMRAFWSARLSGPAAIGVAADLEARAQASLGERVRALPDDANARARVLLDDPAKAMIARSPELDLLVLGSRAHGPLGAIWSGSVSSRVIQEAACPVMVVPRGVRPTLTRPAAIRTA